MESTTEEEKLGDPVACFQAVPEAGTVHLEAPPGVGEKVFRGEVEGLAPVKKGREEAGNSE